MRRTGTMLLAAAWLLAALPAAQAGGRFYEVEPRPIGYGTNWQGLPGDGTVAFQGAAPSWRCPRPLRRWRRAGWRPIPLSPVTGQPLAVFYNSPTSAPGLVRPDVDLVPIEGAW